MNDSMDDTMEDDHDDDNDNDQECFSMEVCITEPLFSVDCGDRVD